MNIRFAAPSGAAEMYEPGSEGALWWEDYTGHRARPQGGRPAGALPRVRHVPEDRRDVRVGRVLLAAPLAEPGGHPCRQGHPAARQRAPLLLAEHATWRRRGRLRARDSRRSVLHAGHQSEPVERHQPRADESAGGLGGERHGAAAQPLSHAGARATSCRRGIASTGFPVIPGQPLPDGVFVPLYDYDFGPAFRAADVSGVMALQPPVVRQVLPQLVPEGGRRRQRAGRRAQRAARGPARHLHRAGIRLRAGSSRVTSRRSAAATSRSRRRRRSGSRRATRACRSRSATARTTPTWRA